MYKNILLADKLHIFSHIYLFALDVIICFIQLNSKQFIFSYQSNLNHIQPQDRQIFGFYF